MPAISFTDHLSSILLHKNWANLKMSQNIHLSKLSVVDSLSSLNKQTYLGVGHVTNLLVDSDLIKIYREKLKVIIKILAQLQLWLI